MNTSKIILLGLVGLIVIVPVDTAVPPNVIVPDVIAPPIEIEPDVIPVFQRAAVPVVVKDVFIVSIVGVVIVGEEDVIIVPEDGSVAPLMEVTPGRVLNVPPEVIEVEPIVGAE